MSEAGDPDGPLTRAVAAASRTIPPPEGAQPTRALVLARVRAARAAANLPVPQWILHCDDCGCENSAMQTWCDFCGGEVKPWG